MRTRTIAIAVGAVVVLGFLAVAAMRSVVPAPEAPADAGPTAEPVAAPVEPVAVAPSAAADEAPPPWARGDDALPVDGTAPTTPRDPVRERQMAELRASMGALVDNALERSVESNEHVRKALDTLEAMDDPAVKAQVNLEAVRHNFEINVRMQALLKETRALQAQPASPQRDQRLQAIQNEFDVLRGQLRNDMVPAGAPVPAPPIGTAS